MQTIIVECREFQIQEEHEAELAKLQDGLNELTLQLKSKSEEIDKLKSEVMPVFTCYISSFKLTKK